MEVVGKEKETIKEVPAGYYYDKYGCYDYGYGRCGHYNNSPYASKGVGGTGLGLGIAGTALGLLALSRSGRGIGLFGNSTPENVNINTTSLSGSNGVTSPHFDESSAKSLVASMYHMSGGKKVSGEKYDMGKAKEITERYRGAIPQSTTYADVYVALNAQYHDYYELMKTWFGENTEAKIIESAISFWFKDDDYKGGNKVYKYLWEA